MLLRLVFFFFLDKSLEPREAAEPNDTLSDSSLLVSLSKALVLVLTSVSSSLSLLSASTALFLLFFWPEISSSSESSLMLSENKTSSLCSEYLRVHYRTSGTTALLHVLRRCVGTLNFFVAGLYGLSDVALCPSSVLLVTAVLKE